VADYCVLSNAYSNRSYTLTRPRLRPRVVRLTPFQRASSRSHFGWQSTMPRHIGHSCTQHALGPPSSELWWEAGAGEITGHA
jgi:hypothetical protein